MAAPGLEEVMGFLTEHGFARAASALRDDVLARTAVGEGGSGDGNPQLPPLRLPASASGGGGAPASPGSSPDSASSDAFVSMRSSPSGLLNPYGLWSPQHARSEASSSEMEFGTAREYDTTDFFFSESWLYDDHLFHGKPEEDDDEDGEEEDKFVVGADGSSRQRERRDLGASAGGGRRHDHVGNAGCEGCTEVYSCSSLLCDCWGGSNKGKGIEEVRDSSSTVYGRYQIMDDQTEVLDECGVDGFRLKRSGDTLLEDDFLRDSGRGEEGSLELSAMEKELQMLSSYVPDAGLGANPELEHDFRSNGELDSSMLTNVKSTDDKYLLKEGHNIQPFPESGDIEDVYELGDFGPVNTDVQDSGTLKAEKDPETNADLALSNFHQEYEVFELRIIHRKNRTGFEENKDFPIVLNSVIAGRYYVTEYLGSAAFSKVVQAHDLQTGMDVCLKIIKNDKDFFDQSLDEIKLLKFVNKYDPADEHHLLRLYDYFYHQEHLFIVTELLRANLYEFQKYNQESGGEVYFTLSRIQVDAPVRLFIASPSFSFHPMVSSQYKYGTGTSLVGPELKKTIARQCLEALVYLHHLRIIHCDLKPENILIKSYSRCEIKVIDLGSSCFLTDNLCLYVQSRSYRAPEVILGLPYDQKIDIWSLGCILSELYTGEVLFPNESVSMMLARIIGIIGPIDMEMLALGQETRNYFTDDYDLFHKNEETDQLEYLIPEKSSLRRHLQCSDSKFVDFLSYLLQINPRKRPTASEALQHRWLSFSYQ